MTAVAATQRPRFSLWVMVAAGGLITALSLGVRSTFGLLLGPIAEGVGSDLGDIAIAVAVQNLLWGVSQPVAGALSDRFGAPKVLSAGGGLYALSLVLMATANGPGTILLTGGFLAGIAIGAASFAVVLSAVGRNAPPERRSMLLGIVSAVGSLGQFFLIPVARWLLDSGSWERTTVILALLLVPIVFIAPLMRAVTLLTTETGEAEQDSSGVTRVQAPTLAEDLRKARRAPAYLLLNAAFFVCGFHVTYIGVHLAGFVDNVGLNASIAATALALIGLFNVFGSLLVGWLGQRFAFTKLLAGIYGLRAVVIGLYIAFPVTSTTTILFAMAMGVLWLSTVPPTSAMVTQQFGPTNAGALFGIVFLSHQLGSFLGAWLGGELFDRTESYAAMWWIAIGLGVVAMVAHLLITEGPVDNPPPGRGLGLASTGAAVFVLIAGSYAAFATIPEASAAEVADGEGFVSYCALGPTLHGP